MVPPAGAASMPFFMVLHPAVQGELWQIPRTLKGLKHHFVDVHNIMSFDCL